MPSKPSILVPSVIRTSALLLSLVLCLEGTVWPSSVPVTHQDPINERLPASRLKVPAGDSFLMDLSGKFCEIKNIHEGPIKKLIIHIQDPHANLSGQKNLAYSLDEIIRACGVSLVLVEGGDLNGTLSPLRKITSLPKTRQVANSLLVQGKISGEEYLSLTSERPIRIQGIEDMSLYRQSVQNYSDLVDRRAAILEYLSIVRGALDRLKRRVYPKPLLRYELKKMQEDPMAVKTRFEELWALAQAGPRPETLFQVAPNLQRLTRLQEKEKSIDFDQANLEQTSLLETIDKDARFQDWRKSLVGTEQRQNLNNDSYTLFKKIFAICKEKKFPISRYPNLVLYDGYLEEFSRLDLTAVLEEMEQWEDRIYAVLLSTQDEKLIRAIDKHTSLLETAYSLRLSAEGFKQFQTNARDFPTLSWLAFLNRKLSELGYFDDLVPYKNLLDDGARNLEAFYISVDRRDEAFIANADRLLNETHAEAAVLIAGGYHTPHLEELMKMKGYSFVVVTPKVFSDTSQAKYEKLLFSPVMKKKRKLRVVEADRRAVMRFDRVRPLQAAARLAEIVEPLAASAGLPMTSGKVREALREMTAQSAGARMGDSDKKRFLDYWRKMNSPSHYGPAKYEGIVKHWEPIVRIVRGDSVVLAPSYIEIHPDEHCQNDCKYCRIRDGEGLRTVPEVEASMSFEHFSALLKDIHDMNPEAFIRLSGTIGDPLINHHILKMLEELKRYGFRWGMTTNGVSLGRNGVIQEALLADYLHISIDAASDQTYRYLKRGKAGYY